MPGAEPPRRHIVPLAYQMSGVREYVYGWPDGRAMAGFRREGEVLVSLEPDAEGFLASEVLRTRLRLAPAAHRP